MTDDKQRIAIAEACGYMDVVVGSRSKDEIYGRLVGDDCRTRLGDYLNDLNAMHEAEKVVLVSESTRAGYYSHLCALDPGRDEWAFEATARQRAEAFLRVVDKWEAPND